MQENILVCVSKTSNIELLIERGFQLSKAFKGNFFILCIQDENNELDYEWLEQKETLERLAKLYNATLILEFDNSRKISSIISSVAVKLKIKQIVLGQPARSKWEVIMHGSIINELFFQLNGVDLHIVEVSKNQAPKEKQYEKGVTAYLIETKQGYELITDGKERTDTIAKGLFFRGTATQFQNGLFKVMSEDEIIIYKVHDGKVVPESASIIKK